MRAYGPTVLRVFLGVVFVMHAYLALVIYTPAGAAAFNAKLGVPLPAVAAWFTILAHGLGGILLIIGLWTRWAALANAVVMLGALIFATCTRASSSRPCSWTASPRRRATSTC